MCMKKQGEFQKHVTQRSLSSVAVLQPDRVPSKSRKAKQRALRYCSGGVLTAACRRIAQKPQGHRTEHALRERRKE